MATALIRGAELAWFTEYLSEKKGAIEQCPYGVGLSVSLSCVQGSILGPLIFVLFVTDVLNVVEERPYQPFCG